MKPSMSRSPLNIVWLATVLVSTSLLSNSQGTSALVTHPLIPHHVQRMRNRRALGEEEESVTRGPISSSLRRRGEEEQVGALFQGYGTHYVDLWCGSPPQRQTVIVDTGSAVTAFPCSGCPASCGATQYHIDRLFDERASSTFEPHTCSNGFCFTRRGSCTGENGKCTITMAYAEGSRWEAYEAIDRCYIGGPHEVPLTQDSGTEGIDPDHASNFSFDMTFGCQTRVTGLFKTQLADGIMGMDNRKDAFWSQMFQAGKMGKNQQFALCFSRHPDAQRKGTEAGALTLGGADTRLHNSPMVFTDMYEGRTGFFSVFIRNIYLRDGSAGESALSSKHPNVMDGIIKLDVSTAIINTGGVIVDSGTTDTYWNNQVGAAFRKAFKTLAGIAHNNAGLTLSEKELHALPTILFQIKTSPNSNLEMDPFTTVGLAGALDPSYPTDVILAIPPTHYMEYESKTGKYTNRFYVTERSGSVLGANAIMGHDVLFDVDNSRIGWAESDCDYTELVASGGYEFPVTGILQEAGSDADSNTNETIGLPGEDADEATDDTSWGTEKPGEDTSDTNDEPGSGSSPKTDNPTEETSQDGTTEMPNEDASETSSTSSDEAGPTATTSWQNAKNQAGKVAQNTKGSVNKFMETCDGPECRYPFAIALALALCMGCCLAYCCSSFCGRSRRPREETLGKYGRAASDEDENGMINGDGSSYQDEPETFDDEPAGANGYEDENSDKPSVEGTVEFEGDFR